MFHQEIAPAATGPGIRASGQSPILSMLDVLSRLWQARWWTLAGAVGMVVIALLGAVIVKPSYEASAQVYIDPQDLQLLRDDLSPNTAPGDSGVVIIESQARIMQSASVLRAVVDQLDLVNDEEFGDGGPSIIRAALDALGLSGGEAVDPVEKAVDRLARAVYVVRADRTYVVDVYARARSAARSAEIANAVVSNYLALRESQRSTQAGSASEALEQRLDTLRTAVKTDEDALELFKAENGIVTSNGSLLIENRLGQANTAVATAAESLARAQVERDQLAAMKDSPELFLASPAALASADISRLRADLERAQAEVSTLSATLGARHPRLAAAQGQLATARAAIAAEVNRLATNAALAYASARSEYDAAVAALAPLTTELQRTDSAQVQLRQLQRQADSSRALYEEALNRSRETREQSQISTLNAQVVSPAVAPVQKRFPPPLSLLLPAALLLGAALGAGLGLLRQTLATHLTPATTPSQTFVARRHMPSRPAPQSTAATARTVAPRQRVAEDVR